MPVAHRHGHPTSPNSGNHSAAYSIILHRYEEEKTRSTKDYKLLKSLHEMLAEQAALDAARAPLVRALSESIKAENWTQAGSIQERLDKLPATVDEQNLLKFHPPWSAQTIGAPGAWAGRNITTSTSPPGGSAGGSISDFLATAWTGDPSSIAMLDDALKRSCGIDDDTVNDRAVIDLLNLGSEESCGGNLRMWNSLKQGIARYAPDHGPRTVVWGEGLRIARQVGGSAEEMCLSGTRAHVDRVANCLNARTVLNRFEPRGSAGADAALCAMVNAGVLFQGIGGTSEIAAAIRDRRGARTVKVVHPAGCQAWDCLGKGGGGPRPHGVALPSLSSPLCSNLGAGHHADGEQASHFSEDAWWQDIADEAAPLASSAGNPAINHGPGAWVASKLKVWTGKHLTTQGRWASFAAAVALLAALALHWGLAWWRRRHDDSADSGLDGQARRRLRQRFKRQLRQGFRGLGGP